MLSSLFLCLNMWHITKLTFVSALRNESLLIADLKQHLSCEVNPSYPNKYKYGNSSTKTTNGISPFPCIPIVNYTYFGMDINFGRWATTYNVLN